MHTVKRILLGAAIALVTGATVPMGVAQAKAGLSPGVEIIIGRSGCSLGFFATNRHHDDLAVTAGHCSQDVNQVVKTSTGVQIGRVVSRMGDDPHNDLYGVTLIQLYRNTAYINDAYFTKFGNPSVGDHVRKYGARTAKSNDQNLWMSLGEVA